MRKRYPWLAAGHRFVCETCRLRDVWFEEKQKKDSKRSKRDDEELAWCTGCWKRESRCTCVRLKRP